MPNPATELDEVTVRLTSTGTLITGKNMKRGEVHDAFVRLAKFSQLQHKR